MRIDNDHTELPVFFILVDSENDSHNGPNPRLTEGNKPDYASPLELEPSSDILVQLRELNKDADSSVEFVCGVNDIICTTIPVNIALVLYGVYAIFETAFGIRHLANCPVEPRIPIFLFVGGCSALLKITHMLYTNYRSRKHSMYVAEAGSGNTHSTVEIVDAALNVFLLGWQVTGVYWTLRVWFPHFSPPLHEPSNWCHQGLYVFTLVQLLISAVILVGRVIFQCGLVICYSCTDVFESHEI